MKAVFGVLFVLTAMALLVRFMFHVVFVLAVLLSIMQSSHLPGSTTLWMVSGLVSLCLVIGGALVLRWLHPEWLHHSSR